MGPDPWFAASEARSSGASTAVVALGGNALLRRGEPLEAANQARAARIIGAAALHHRLAITHGNGPQVGLSALMSDAYTDVAPRHQGVEAVVDKDLVSWFVERTGGRGAIGSLDELQAMLAGRAGTQVLADGPEIQYTDGDSR